MCERRTLCKREGCKETVANGLPWCLEHLVEIGEVMEKYPPVSEELYKKV